MKVKFVTISRNTGSLGDEIAKQLAEKQGVLHITRDYVLKNWFPEIASAHELHMLSESPSYFAKTSSRGITFQKFLEEKLHETIASQSVVISGMGSQIIFQDHAEALHIKITGSREIRVKRMIDRNNLSYDDAKRILELTDRRHKRYILILYQTDWMDTLIYDLTINTDRIDTEEALSIIMNLYNRSKERTDLTKQEEKKLPKEIHFKNESEEEFAKVLDMYNLEWEYEPRTFPLKWDSEGNITQAFSPDFYLPRFNTYIELTIMNQKYTSGKRKKMALLKKLYPGTNISIVYKDDFHSLVKRFAQWGGHVHE
jgi:cytidylate kinase